MEDRLNEIFSFIHWNSDRVRQKEGIEMAKSISDISFFIQPGTNKAIWENCAVILQSRSDSELSPYLSKLLEWTQDINWPGAQIIYDRLRLIPASIIVEQLKVCVTRATSASNQEWLAQLAGFADNDEVSRAFSQEELNALQDSKEAFWGGSPR